MPKYGDERKFEYDNNNKKKKKTKEKNVFFKQLLLTAIHECQTEVEVEISSFYFVFVMYWVHLFRKRFFSHELLTNVDTLRLMSVLDTHSCVSKIDIVPACEHTRLYE